MQLYKTIVQGRLEFGNQRSYDQVLKMFLYRVESYYKMDIFLEAEEIFDESTFRMSVPRLVKQVSSKTFKNTVNLVEYCAQFAISGSLKAWLIEEGKILKYYSIEPDSDKAAVQDYIKGKKLFKQSGKENEALKALTNAIEKFDKHAMAYEKRARVNFMLKKYHEALRDYNKSLNIDPTNASAYYGRALIYKLQEDYEKAIVDLDETLKKSIALQPIYWEARRHKSDCHLALKQYEKSAFDLKLFTKRPFKEVDVNHSWRKYAFFQYGKVLLELGQFEEALTAFESALKIKLVSRIIQESDILLYRGIAKQKAGKNGYLNDLKQSSILGNKKASKLLAEIA